MDVTTISQPDVFIFGIRVLEPVTTITDLLVGAVCFYAFWKIQKEKLSGKPILYMKYYFLTMGIATCIGGLIGHGFLYAVNEHWKLLGWYISMVSVALIERSAMGYAGRFISARNLNIFMAINILELLTFMTLTAISLHFKYVQVHSFYGLLIIVFSFHLFTYIKSKDAGSKLMIQSVFILSIAAFIFNYPIVIHEWFNHRDFAHILMAIGSYIFLRATLNFKNEAKS